MAYPDSTATDTGRAQRDAYWNWFADHWNADKAVTVVEEVIGVGGRPRWIAYRMTFPGGTTTLHLDVSARGDYDTGVFAYNYIRRGERYGLRIVGSLKSSRPWTFWPPTRNRRPATGNRFRITNRDNDIGLSRTINRLSGLWVLAVGSF